MSELEKYINQSDVIYQKTKILDGRSIGITGWKVKHENSLLYAIETKPKDENNTIEHCINMARNCVDNVELYDSLPRNTLLHLITQIRKMSKGGEIEITYHCNNKECPTWVQFDPIIAKEMGIEGRGNIPLDDVIDLDNDIKIKGFDDIPLKVDKYTFHLQEIPFFEQLKLEDMYLNDENNMQIVRFNNELLLQCIKRVEVEELENPIDDFSMVELRAIIDQLQPNDFKKMINEFAEALSEFQIIKEVSCLSCGESRKLRYRNIFSLLVF